MLATRPSDRRDALVAATEDLQAAESRLAATEAAASRTAGRLEEIGAARRVEPTGPGAAPHAAGQVGLPRPGCR